MSSKIQPVALSNSDGLSSPDTEKEDEPDFDAKGEVQPEPTMGQTLSPVLPPCPSRPIELYLVRLSPPCRAVWLYMLQHEIPHILIDVDFTNEKKAPDFIAKYPHKEVPILVDGEITVFDGPPILRYLAMQYTHFTGFGITMQTKLLTESLLSWANSELHRAVGFNYAYASFLECYRLSTDEANEALIESGIKNITKYLERIETGYLSKTRYLTGERMTVADSYVATMLLQVEWIGFKFRLWPKVESWLRRVKAQEYWSEVHAAHKELVTEIEYGPYFE